MYCAARNAPDSIGIESSAIQSEKHAGRCERGMLRLERRSLGGVSSCTRFRESRAFVVAASESGSRAFSELGLGPNIRAFGRSTSALIQLSSCLASSLPPHSRSSPASRSASSANAQGTAPPARQVAARDPMQEGLPLRPGRTLTFTTNVGHWMSVDVSPDGQTLVFDLFGDLYTMPIAGGTATPLTRGMAFDGQPRWSPDGKKVVFVSDRDGGWNLWTISADKRDTAQVTRGKTNNYFSPEWTPDGKYIVATRGTKIWMFHVDGGSGQQLIRPQPGQGGGGPAGRRRRRRQLAPDGRRVRQRRSLALVRAARRATRATTRPMGDWQLYVYDRETGRSASRTSRWGSAFRPALSPDGKWLVYGTRHVDTTRLRVRDLETRRRAVARDERAARRQGVGGRARCVSRACRSRPTRSSSSRRGTGGCGRCRSMAARAQEIPFQANVVQAVGPEVKFEYPISDSATFIAKQIRDAVPSPDGKRLAFIALDRLYVMDLPVGSRRGDERDRWQRIERRDSRPIRAKCRVLAECPVAGSDAAARDGHGDRRVRADVVARRAVDRVHDVVGHRRRAPL